MDGLNAILLAVVEGLTEFLPVSSTGHLILAAAILGIPQTGFVKSFELAIQFGAILSVVASYWRFFLDFQVLKRLFVAFLPTGVVGFVFYRIFKEFLLGNLQIVLWALLLGGVFLIVFELLYDEKPRTEELDRIPYRHCLLIGAFQALSIIPGVSRSAPTIVGGLAIGMKRRTIVLFSFLLAVPTMVAATAFDLIESAAEFSSNQIGVLVLGFTASFLVALVTIRLFLNYVQNHNFIIFGVYRIVIAILFYILVVT